MTVAERMAAALDALRAGRPVIVVDNEDRENEGDLILAAEVATPEWIAFTVEHTSGYLCAPLSADRADRLDLPLMVVDPEDPLRTAYTVSVDARTGVTTGISAADRARTVQVLAAPGTRPGDLRRPGHILPLRAVPGGVRQRAGHTEAAVELCALAGLSEVSVIGEIVSKDDPTSMARRDELDRFARDHDLVLLSITELIEFLDARDAADVVRVTTTTLPLSAGVFRAYGYRDADGTEHVALTMGDLTTRQDVVVRVHSECLTGDAFGSLRCDCGAQLESALDAVADAGAGAVIYLRGHEGRGIGLLNKLRAYHQQDQGLDTVDANAALGLPVDARDYSVAAHILTDLGVRSLQLLTNNPDKATVLRANGLAVEMVPTAVHVTAHNASYLRTKRDRLGHRFDGPATVPAVAPRDADLTGRVVEGVRRGRTLGLPTANLQLEPGTTLPDAGVYAGFVQLAGDVEGRRRAAVAVGGRPTFDEPAVLVEVYVLDLDGGIELAGSTMQVWLEFFLRPVLHFSTTEALVQHMTRDVAEIRQLLPSQADPAPVGRR